MYSTEKLECAAANLRFKQIAVNFPHKDAAWAIAICDAVNRMAEEESDKDARKRLYKLKFECIEEAVGMRCDAGWGQDGEGDWVLYLRAPGIGTASFHDIKEEVKGVPWDRPWPRGWTANRRRPFAFAALSDSALRELLNKDLGEQEFGLEREELGYDLNGYKSVAGARSPRK